MESCANAANDENGRPVIILTLFTLHTVWMRIKFQVAKTTGLFRGLRLIKLRGEYMLRDGTSPIIL